MKNNNMKKTRENQSFMKTEKVFVEPEGHQEARDRHCVHVSRVQTIIFHFCIYVLFEILTVFNLKCLL